MEQFIVKTIGKVRSDENGIRIELEKAFIPGLRNLEGFGYINVLWWFHHCDTEESRSKLIEKSPYKGSPDTLGTFATRAPERPNPIALTCVYISYLEVDKGIIGLAYIDAEDGTPVLDIKPYTPSFDRVEKPIVPNWCSNWPRSIETSGDYDWSAVFS
ncbi:tRNA (N6-threonylcarbamoyladenosine(37)-N6)-methyltransferase TrmO [Robertmurraya siralis]|uniref:tRNA (N6-threonylcarbamoyladenosine(37)-N6)-methyltransferase TrmO n=1 Tax=Robertmurraya siralis TaxID=77777 RepID=A0A920BTV1_9BACI|nr:SAM-dependent methyltransferase [Robertmurraya siralis]PAE21481.1 tRNA (N6-threonylcarbamoyladenosine(37)-N6)-methyltransferase TrmO [Bacillus sp. 7504-2]GIN61627.1 tRNA (N6-threonylcarbamoyladenosine(37)-N6)-methyltransferase TrmO [Robertmurraya siralis]